MKPIFIIILILFAAKSMAQCDTATVNFYSQIQLYDLSSVINTDSIIDDINEKFKRSEILGYIDTTFQRFQIHFITFKKDDKNPYKYIVSGKTKVKGNICDFNGSLTIVNARILTHKPIYLESPLMSQGYVICNVILYENRNQLSTGVINGKLTTNFLIDNNNKIRYDAIMAVADGFCNNQFEGLWTSYKTGKSIICNWGDYRIPQSKYLDWGTGEFSPSEKYLNYGWKTYHDYLSIPTNDPKWKEIRIEELEWWK